MNKYQDILETINFARYRDIFRRFTIDIEDYTFSILTGSHLESATLGTVEIAILKSDNFVLSCEEASTDDAIIHYMSFEMFENFINELENTKTQDLEKLFFKYKEQYENE